MRWLAATVALLAASAGLVIGLYLRDRDPHWLPPQRKIAAYDAQTMLLQMHCGQPRCSYTLVANPRPFHWVARIDDGAGIRCYDINVISFDTTTSHGVSGIATVRCGAAPETPAAGE
jgi:hypothetical protein